MNKTFINVTKTSKNTLQSAH